MRRRRRHHHHLRNSISTEQLKRLSQHYNSEKYRIKYPEFFSTEFESFCMSQVIPLYRKTKEKIFKGSDYNKKLGQLILIIAVITLILLINIQTLGFIANSIFQSVFVPFLPDTTLAILNNEKNSFAIFLFIFLMVIMSILTYSILKSKMKNAILQIAKIFTFGAAFFILALFIIYSNKSHFSTTSANGLAGLYIIIPFFTIAIIVYGNYIKKLKKEYKLKTLEIKKAVFPILLSKISKCSYLTPQDKNYDISKYLDNLVVLKMRGGIIENSLDDHFRMIYNDLKLNIAEISLPGFKIKLNGFTKEDQIDMQYGGNSIFLKVKSNKAFNGKTIITRTCEYNLNLDNVKYSSVITEDMSFNKIFTVKTTDQVDARYMLTPTFMERLKEYAKEYPHHELNISFENGFINIILSKGFTDLFEIVSFDQNAMAATDETIAKLIQDAEINIDTYRDILIEIKEFLTVVDALKLDSTIGL